MKECSQDAIDLLQLSDRTLDIRFENNCADNCIVLGDEQRLQQVFVNLLSNARDASPSNSIIRIESEIEKHSITIKVIDQGTGIDAGTIEQIFEPFFTTKEVGKGTGLGLALVYSIIEEHYGHINIQSPADEIQGNGTCVVISLPRFQDESDV